MAAGGACRNGRESVRKMLQEKDASDFEAYQLSLEYRYGYRLPLDVNKHILVSRIGLPALARFLSLQITQTNRAFAGFP